MSVPHSGTRTLLEITGYNAVEQGMHGAGTWWHFGAHEALLKMYNPEAHIPIRNPLDVARSWASRRKTGDVLGEMLKRYRCMFEYLESNEAIFHRMEELPRIVGLNEHADEDRSVAIREFQSAVREHVIEPHRDFFARFYGDL